VFNYREAHLSKTKTLISRFPQSYFKKEFFVRENIIIIKKIAGIFVYSIIRGVFKMSLFLLILFNNYYIKDILDSNVEK
jgi:hypothetical protein